MAKKQQPITNGQTDPSITPNTAMKEAKVKIITISRPRFETFETRVIGTSYYVQNKFSQKAANKMKETQEAGSVGKRSKGRAKDPKNFEDCYAGALHRSAEGWYGIPAVAFKAAMVSACKICGVKMTEAKLAFFIIADGLDEDGFTELVRITRGEPERFEAFVKIQLTADIRVRPRWDPGWEARLKVKYDAGMFTEASIVNLLVRAGCQVGIGEGRPDSKMSVGQGWGTFKLEEEKMKGKNDAKEV